MGPDDPRKSSGGLSDWNGVYERADRSGPAGFIQAGAGGHCPQPGYQRPWYGSDGDCRRFRTGERGCVPGNCLKEPVAGGETGGAGSGFIPQNHGTDAGSGLCGAAGHPAGLSAGAESQLRQQLRIAQRALPGGGLSGSGRRRRPHHHLRGDGKRGQPGRSCRRGCHAGEGGTGGDVCGGV